MSAPEPPEGYLIEEVLSAGGGRCVARAHRTHAHRAESPGRASASDLPLVLRWERPGAHSETGSELSALAAIQHPGIAGLEDHGSLPDGGSYVVREWIEGQDLLTWARGQGPEDIGILLGRLAGALAHLHQRGFAHGDLKPENIIVTPDGAPILCDFGLAHSLEKDPALLPDPADLGASGTLFSLAPERLMGFAATEAGDLFALGAMLHRLLVHTEVSAREFYTAFPESSFLDAIGTDPEELPAWSRDLVAALTARDPGRRPRSAGEVERTLATRLGAPFKQDTPKESLHWPVSFGREAWVAEWLLGAESAGFTAQWIQTPGGENARPFYEHLRIHAALRGWNSRGIDLENELRGVQDGIAIDRWAEAIAGQDVPLIVALLSSPDPWHIRALNALRRGLQVRSRDRSEGLLLVCISSSKTPGADEEEWEREALPAVDLVATRRFVDRELRNDEEEPRREFAQQLHLAARGSATRASWLLRRASAEGLLLYQEGSFRLRPGSPVALTALDDGGQSSPESHALNAPEKRILDTLDICGKGASPDDILRIADANGPEGTQAFDALKSLGWIAVEHTNAGAGVRRQRSWSGSFSGMETVRALHARRGAELAGGTGERGVVLLHSFCAAPDTHTATELRDALRELRERGQAERALAIGDRLTVSAAQAGIQLLPGGSDDDACAFAILLIERARAWCAIGQTEMALETIKALGNIENLRVLAGVELVRAQVASLRHETEEAFALFSSAAARHADALPEATLGRIQLLHTLGRDEELLRAVAEFEPEGREAEGLLSTRQRAYVESLQAMSMQRRGRVAEARDLTRSLIEGTRETEDPGLEAALHINLSLIERSSGSLQRARTELETAIELYDRAGLVAGLAHAKATLGGLLRETGDLLSGEPLLAAAYETRMRLGDGEGALTAQGMLGLLLFERGFARSAIETLDATAKAMRGAQKRRFTPYLAAKALEMRARIGSAQVRADESPLADLDKEVDPRILSAKSRIAWMTGDVESATDYAQRARALADSLKLERYSSDAQALLHRLAGSAPDPPPATSDCLEEIDASIHAALQDQSFDPNAAEELAKSLAKAGCNDRAARLFLALSTRVRDSEQAHGYALEAEALLSECTRGLTEAEGESLRQHLLGEPDAWPGDLTRRKDDSDSTWGFEEEFLGLLDINRQLIGEEQLPVLLGSIVEHALRVTGAERGFLVLEADGELRFDTAFDSRRGNIAEPELEVSASIIRDALEHMQAVRVSNAVDDPLLGHRTSIVSLELRSVLCVPFEIDARLRGAIYVDHRLRNGAFSDRSARLCSLLAIQAAIVIQKTNRLDEIRELNLRLEQRVTSSQADLAAARKALEDKNTSQPLLALVGNTRVMENMRQLLQRAAPSFLPVLISGDSGTGKELAARALHGLSERKSFPFITENCAAIPAQLIESELFGFKRGAFTGADRDHVGLFEQSSGGTLFLDEIGDLPLELQGKLLRVLETHTIRRLGDNETRAVQLRLVVATNRDLALEVDEGRFRSDLYYRLNGIAVEMPRLRERSEDIPLLVAHLLELEQPGRRISRTMLNALARRPWPGNVRELKNEIARLCLFSDGDLDDPSLISSPRIESPTAAMIAEGCTLAELEKKAIQAALLQTGDDKSKAAKLLGISRAKIYQRLKEWESDG